MADIDVTTVKTSARLLSTPQMMLLTQLRDAYEDLAVQMGNFRSSCIAQRVIDEAVAVEASRPMPLVALTLAERRLHQKAVRPSLTRLRPQPPSITDLDVIQEFARHTVRGFDVDARFLDKDYAGLIECGTVVVAARRAFIDSLDADPLDADSLDADSLDMGTASGRVAQMTVVAEYLGGVPEVPALAPLAPAAPTVAVFGR